MINEQEKVKNQKNDKDSVSEGSDHSLSGFDENVSYSEFVDENNNVEEQVENKIIEEDVPERIEMRCG